ncbi:hypothetical protein ACN47E_003993 [Coniothyrium glycines]
MSAATASKAGTPRREVNTRTSSSSPSAATRTPTKASTATTNGAGSPARRQSVRSGAVTTPSSARASVKKPAAGSNLRTASPADDTDDDVRDAKAALFQDLKDRLQKAETEADERQKVIEVLNAKLDDALAEQAKLEERAHEEEEKVEALENFKRELTRQHRELEGIYEAEQSKALKEKEETQTREEGLLESIQRLKQTLASKNVPTDDEEPHLSRASSIRNGVSRTNSSANLDSFAPPSSIQRSNSRNNSKLILQKDKIIEDLRMELAECQVKIFEAQNAGGGRMRELEKQLLDVRVANARLMEDNESFQLLLGEKTLNGELSNNDILREHTERDVSSPKEASTSLADELSSLEAGDATVVHKLEAEINSMKDQNKALTLYINKIIGRLITYKGFESVLGVDGDADEAPNTNKELPPPPPQDDEPQGFLQRAKSVVGGKKPRPLSMMGPPAIPAREQSAHEDPTTAPSIPLARSTSGRHPSGGYHHHRRSTSEVPGAASLVNNMFRTPNVITPSATSPSIVSPRNSFFGLPVNNGSNPVSRQPSGQQGRIPEDQEVDNKSEVTTSSNASHVDTPSPPRRLERSETSGPMTGKGMRPLRLVQNEEEMQKQRKAANRASWFGGLFGQQQPAQQQENAQ